MLLSLALASALAAAQTPRPAATLDDPLLRSSPSGTGLVCAADGLLGVAAWLDDRSTSGKEDLYAAVTLDGGLSWQPETALTQGSALGIDVDGPRAAAAGGVLHLIWDDDRNGSSDTLCYARSTDGGQSWQSTVLYDGSTSSRLYAEADTVVVLFTARPNHSSRDELWSLWSLDGGLSWAPPLAVDPANQGSQDVDGYAADLEDLVLHLAFEDDRNGQDDLFYASTTAGQPWSPPLRLDQDPTGLGEISTSTTEDRIHVAADGWSVHVLWEEEGRSGPLRRLYYRRSLDLGLSWEPESALGTTDPASVAMESSALDAGNGQVLVAWVDDREADRPVRATVSPDGGATFPVETAVGVPGGSEADSLRALVSGSRLILAWEEDGPSAASLDEWSAFAWSADAGLAWTDPVFLDTFAGDEDVDQPATAWAWNGEAFLGVWQTDGGSGGSSAIRSSGLRFPWAEAEVGTGVARLGLGGAEPGLLPARGRWACSTAAGQTAHPELPGAVLELGPSLLLDRSLRRPDLFQAPLQADGTAWSDWLEIPPPLAGAWVRVQAWVLTGGTAGQAGEPLDLVLP